MSRVGLLRAGSAHGTRGMTSQASFGTMRGRRSVPALGAWWRLWRCGQCCRIDRDAAAPLHARHFHYSGGLYESGRRREQAVREEETVEPRNSQQHWGAFRDVVQAMQAADEDKTNRGQDSFGARGVLRQNVDRAADTADNQATDGPPGEQVLYRTISFTCHGKTVHTTYTNDSAVVTEWLETHVLPQEPDEQGRILLGLDAEWRPTYSRRAANKAAVLQLATDDAVLVFHLAHVRPQRKEEFTAQERAQVEHLPRIGVARAFHVPRLLDVFRDTRVVMVGVGVGEDVKKLAADYGFPRARRAETDAPLRQSGIADGKKSLAVLSSSLLGATSWKQGSVTMSNWETKPLAVPQIVYAAKDAWFSLTLYRFLEGLAERQAWDRQPAPSQSAARKLFADAAFGYTKYESFEEERDHWLRAGVGYPPSLAAAVAESEATTRVKETDRDD